MCWSSSFIERVNPWHSDIDGLRDEGFEGFVPIRVLRQGKLHAAPGEPGDAGVYVVVRPESAEPVFLDRSTGGWFKRRDPSVGIDELKRRWVSGSPVLYVGKAGGPGSPVTLRSRLKQYLDFGAGRPIGHWGGRLIWQLASAEDLCICWKRTPNQVPRSVEQKMIREFVSAFGVRPFANLRD